jgi:hypothetical protein
MNINVNINVVCRSHEIITVQQTKVLHNNKQITTNKKTNDNATQTAFKLDEEMQTRTNMN